MVELENITLLGAPVLPGRAIDKAIKQKTEKTEKAISRLPLLQAHDALTLLKNSISVTKLLYTLRTSNCSENPLHVTFDTRQRKCLTDVINNRPQWRPVDTGHSLNQGWRSWYRSVAMLAPSDFLALATSTLQIQNAILPARFHGVADNAMDVATNSWRKLSVTDIPKIELRVKQKEWDKDVTKKNSTELLDRANCPLDKARLRAATAPHAWDWLLAPPITAVGLRMKNETIRVATGLRLAPSSVKHTIAPVVKQSNAEANMVCHAGEVLVASPDTT